MLKKIVLHVFIVSSFIALTLIAHLIMQETKLSELREEHIQEVADHNAEKVSIFLSSQKEKAGFLATLAIFTELVQNPQDQKALENAKKAISDYQTLFPGIGVFNKDGILLASENNPVGADYSSLPIFPIGNDTNTFFTRYYDSARKTDYYAVGALIYAPDNSDEVIGLVGFDVKLDAISELISDSEHAYNLEVFLTDSSGLLLSRSSYIGLANKNGVLIQEVGDFASEKCLKDLGKYAKSGIIEEHEEAIEAYVNYMGYDVLGAHAYVPEILGCVIAEELQTKSFGPLMSGFLNKFYEEKF